MLYAETMTPTFMIGKDRVAVLGAKGGSRIITGVLLGVLGIEQGLDSSQIVALPRYHHQYLPDTIFQEKDALAPEVMKALEAMGHRLAYGAGPVVLMHSVDWDRAAGVLHAGADPRNPPGAGIVVPAKAEKKR